MVSGPSFTIELGKSRHVDDCRDCILPCQLGDSPMVELVGLEPTTQITDLSPAHSSIFS